MIARRVSAASLLIGLVALIASVSTDPDDDTDTYAPFRSEMYDTFSWSLLKFLLEDEPQNVVCSPFAVKLMLASLFDAAGDNSKTQEELVNAAGLSSNLRDYYKRVLFSLKKEKPHYELKLETRLFVDAFIKPNQRFAAIMNTFYDMTMEQLEFIDSGASASNINAWSANVTRGHLKPKQLVTEDNIRNNVIVMANIVYFHGIWRRSFNYSNTYRGIFNQQQEIEYMEQTENFYYFESPEDNAKILRLPYKGKELAMFIILPTSKGGVEELAHTLQNKQLKHMQWRMEEQKVRVTLPKFKIDITKNLKHTLRQLGVNELFTDGASLPGLARGSKLERNLKVSKVYQHAGIEVNEEGGKTYAAAVHKEEDSNIANAEFNVDRPFIFFIEDEPGEIILIAGQVYEPHL